MTISLADVKRYPEAAALADRLAADIAARLSQAIAQRGLASLVVSGGNSPVKLFQALRTRPLDWSRVCVALADERWVQPTDSGSNEKLVRDNLLRDGAAAARFAGLKNAAPSPDLGAAAAWETFAHVPRPFDVTVLGMGDAKLRTFTAASGSGPVEDMPVRAVLRQDRTPVEVVWAP